MIKRSSLLLALSLAAIGSAQAADLQFINTLGQPYFRGLSEDLGAALSYKPVEPTLALGITGFDIGVEATATSLENTAAYTQATGSSTSTLVVPKLHAHKGLPLGFDIGAFYSAVPSSNIKLIGGEIRYALMDGGIAKPAIGVRLSHTKLSGVNQLDFNTTGLDVSISKGFTLFTPYAGAGVVRVNSNPHVTAPLTEEKFNLPKYFAGLNANFVALNLAAEVDKTGDATSYSLKMGWRF